MNGDKSPQNDPVLLPVGTTKTEVFKQYCDRTPEIDQVKESQFFKVWTKEHQNISTPRVSTERSLS